MIFLYYKDFYTINYSASIMRHSYKTGFSFGFTSGIITTLGLIVGLHASTYSLVAVIGGIFTIGIADAFSDALGIHMSEESEGIHSSKEVWEATFITFVTKLCISLSFVIPILLFTFFQALAISLLWGFSLIIVFSILIADKSNSSKILVVSEHIIITIFVIISAHFVGLWISNFFSF